MAKMSRKDLEDIISRDKPGFSILAHEAVPADPDAVDAGDAPDAGTGLDLEELRRRYLGDGAADDADVADAAGESDATAVATAEAEGNADDEIVVLTPDGDPADPWAPGPGRKSVVVSGKQRRVVAEQG